MKLQALGLQLSQKKIPVRVFSREFCEIFRMPTLQKTSGRLLLDVKQYLKYLTERGGEIAEAQLVGFNQIIFMVSCDIYTNNINI